MPNFVHATFASGTPYAILGGHAERLTSGQSEFSLIVACPWEVRFQLCLDFLGHHDLGSPGQDRFDRLLPEFYQPTAGEPDFRLPCVVMQLLNPQGNVTALPLLEPPDPPVSPGVTYQFADGSPGMAIYRAIFTSVDYPILEDSEISDGQEWLRYVLIDERYSTEAQRYPGGVWTIVGTTEEIIEETAIPYHTRELTLTWLHVPFFHRANIEACLNRVNDAEIVFTRGLGVEYRYEPETLLFAGWEHQMERSGTGILLWNLRFHFKWRASTWNKFFRAYGADGAGHYEVIHKDTLEPPYASTDLLKIFSIVSPP